MVSVFLESSKCEGRITLGVFPVLNVWARENRWPASVFPLRIMYVQS